MSEPSTPEGPSLVRMLEEAIRTSGAVADRRYDVACTSCRIPRAVLDEIGTLAQHNRMSVSLLINLLLDAYLLGQGRPAYAELAPWYGDYAMRAPFRAEAAPKRA